MRAKERRTGGKSAKKGDGMKRLWLLSAALLAPVLVVTLMAGCGSSGTSANGKTYTITNTKISAKVGDQFTIQLTSNATTGYQWGISGSLNSAVVKKVSSTYVASPNPKGMTGVGGVEKWKFQAVGKGTGTIVLVYRQPFDKTAKPAQTATFTITVQ
jgi:inhibitor of cysteine peptidase